MHHLLKTTIIPALALGLALLAVPALADSTSSASSASSTSIGSSSASIEKSSNSSSTKDRVAQGQYTILAMTAVAQQPDMVRLRLQAVADTSEFFLLVPRSAVQGAQLAEGQAISAEHRPYGLAFATLGSAGNTPFFLVLDDEWFRELESRPVGV